MTCISEVYACGRNGTSSFAIVEEGAMVHHGSHRWGDFIDYGGVSMPVNDDDCELMAVVCGLLVCRDNGCKMVNVYTGRDDCQRRYYRGVTGSVFEPVLAYLLAEMDVYAERWQDEFCEEGVWVENTHRSFVEILTIS